MSVITLHEQIECVKREISMRRRVYPRWIAAGKMTAESGDREIARMQAVLSTLERVQHDAKRPDPLGEALNSGDGTYRP